MKCEQLQEHLTAFLLGDLDEATRSEVDAHLKQCEGCRAERRELELTLDLVRDALSASSSTTVPQRLTPDRRARITSTPPVRRSIRVLRWFSTSHPKFALAAAACLVIAFVIAGMMMPGLSRARPETTRSYECAMVDLEVPADNGIRNGKISESTARGSILAGAAPKPQSGQKQQSMDIGGNATIVGAADRTGHDGKVAPSAAGDRTSTVDEYAHKGVTLGWTDSKAKKSTGTDWKLAEMPAPPATETPPPAPVLAPGAVAHEPKSDRGVFFYTRTDVVDARKATAELKDVNRLDPVAGDTTVGSPESDGARGSVAPGTWFSSALAKRVAAAPTGRADEERAANDTSPAKGATEENPRLERRARIMPLESGEAGRGLRSSDQPVPEPDLKPGRMDDAASIPRASGTVAKEESKTLNILAVNVRDKTTPDDRVNKSRQYNRNQEEKDETVVTTEGERAADPAAGARRREGRLNEIAGKDAAKNTKESGVAYDSLRGWTPDAQFKAGAGAAVDSVKKLDRDKWEMAPTVSRPAVPPPADETVSFSLAPRGKMTVVAQEGGTPVKRPTPSKAREEKVALATTGFAGQTLSAAPFSKTEEPRNLPAKFRAFGVNPFVDAASQPFSTFSIDVDTASYTISRNYMLRGQRPPVEAVRTEDFVNFFDYAYAAPTRETFRVYADVAPSKFGSGLQLVKIGVKGKRLGREEQRGAVLTFLIDTSGSMDKPDRIGLIRKSLKMLLDKLNPQDQVAIVQFDSNVRLALDHTPASEKEKIVGVLDALQCSGSTHLEGGMLQAYEVAARGFNPKAENRVLILSDGVANLGTMAAEDILTKVEAYRKQGIYCSVFGFGIGTFDDTMLQTLANKGNGSYAFIDSEVEAKRVFVDDLAATLNTIAADVKIQVEFNPKRVAKYRQIGYEKRQLKKDDFRNDAVDAGEVGSGQSVTALYEVELKDGRDSLATVRLRYRRTDNNRVEEVDRAVTAADLKPEFEKADARFRLAACAAEFSEQLRGSTHAAGSDFADVASALRPVALELPLDSQVQELLRMVQSAGSLSLAAQ